MSRFRGYAHAIKEFDIFINDRNNVFIIATWRHLSVALNWCASTPAPTRTSRLSLTRGNTYEPDY
ncbi:hypothetical protein GO730_03890 [Spirosoma sp. HMF3257]|uniref:hypothetical protein n=1 Tax=Spirosoma telluris TaxID=2183553 RepID=UPI0011B94670|nr:hypothetical protein [Spirosoma telluris]